MSVYSPLFAATLLAAIAGTAPVAMAQPATGQTTAEQHSHSRHAARPAPGRFIEGRLAFLRTELKLTEAQLPLFERLADEMRAGAKAMEARHAERKTQAKAQPASAVERLERRSAVMKQVTAASDRYLEALKPLYASLSDEQKQVADQLLGSRHGGHKHHRGMRHH